MPERRSEIGADVRPVLRQPVAHLRSPILEGRATEALPPDPDRASVAIPTVATLVQTLAWALLPAIPMLALVGWLAALAMGAVAMVIRELGKRAGRASCSFGDGFIPFRPQDGWPHGLQEEDEVAWKWSPARNGRGAHG